MTSLYPYPCGKAFAMHIVQIMLSTITYYNKGIQSGDKMKLEFWMVAVIGLPVK
jgi:hypothetical protein